MPSKPLQAVLAACLLACVAQAAPHPDLLLPRSPDQQFGPFYAEVERSGLFPDQKSFADCVPKRDPMAILGDYLAAKASGKPFDLKAFVEANFIVPQPPVAPDLPAHEPLKAHLEGLWDVLQRRPDTTVAGSSLLPLAHPYIVPGGRFREVYYWDSYFTMLGLRASGREDLVVAMVDNFASLVNQFGLIPNGNRTYYLSRSQPPFFALMVELVAEKDPKAYVRYLPALEREYAYWTDKTFPTHHVVVLPGAGELDRYYDRGITPRAEAFTADEATAKTSTEPPTELYRNLRSAAESGWDFSSRWLADGRTLGTIQTTQIVPVDLNALLWQLETTLSKAYTKNGQMIRAAEMYDEAAVRKRSLMTACWSEEAGFFVDARLNTSPGTVPLTLAGMFPLFLKMADSEQADAVARTIESQFLKPGGVVTTLAHTGQQWDAPNGWAPLEWVTISGLINYGKADLARTIATRWMALNRSVYQRTGKLMEKYDVEDLSKPGGGGEYPSQDGFGWTNGVLLKLMEMYPEAAEPAAH